MNMLKKIITAYETVNKGLLDDNTPNNDETRANVKLVLEMLLPKECHVICNTKNNPPETTTECIAIATVVWEDNTTNNDVLVFGTSNVKDVDLIFGTPEQISKTYLLIQD